MKIINAAEFKHEQLKSKKTNEFYSFSDLISKKMESRQLFFHHDIIPPLLKTSAAHRHTVVEEVVYVVKGEVTAEQKR